MRNLIECNNVIPHIFIINDDNQVDKVVVDHAKLYSIAGSYIYSLKPEKDELTVEQIKDLLSMTRFSATHPSLITIHALDKSSSEVQNMLLKSLEEISERHHFLLFVSRVDSLLPTIQSRCSIINLIEKDVLIQNKGKEVPVGDYFSLALNSEVSREEAIKKIDIYLYTSTSIISSVKMLSHILHVRSLIENNNIDPSMGLDSILLFSLKHSTMKERYDKKK